MIIEAEIKQWGNSYGIRIPKRTAEKLAIEKGDTVDLEIIRRHLRMSEGFGMCKGIGSFKRDPADDFHRW